MLPALPVERIGLPAAPTPPPRAGFPWAATLAPVVVSLVLWAVTRSIFSLMFATLGPVVAVAGVVDGRVARRRTARRAAADRERELDLVRARVEGVQRARREHLLGLIARAEAPAWHDDDETLPVRLATGTVSSAVVLDPPSAEEHADLVRAAADPGDMPVVVDSCHGIGVLGPPALAAATARAVAVQLAARLSPATASLRAPGGEPWVHRLPHALDPGDPGVYDWTIAERSVVVAWAEVAADLPLGCRVRLDLAAQALDGPGVVPQTGAVSPLALTGAEASQAAAVLSRRAVEAGLRAPGSGLPGQVLLGELLAASGGTAAAAGLACPIGADEAGPVTLDLIADGPHALISGTTGTGKSELLVSWILSMAHGRSPAEVTFLLVDFKGGAAFAPLARLAHVVATLSDLDGPLTRRAIESLRAELLRRERVLATAGARAIDELPAGTLARLVVVVDEFAAVVGASPDLHEVFADLAARGRSLGLHLVVCTQRPAGVVRDAVLANIGLRISLRVTDRGDSIAMVGDDSAARLPAEPRGRAILAGAGQGPTRTIQIALADTATADTVITADGPHPDARPWHDPLPADIPLDGVPPVTRGFAFGLTDLPAEQTQPPAAYDPARHGHLLVVGASGSGCTTALTTLAEAARRAGARVRVVSPDPADAWAQVSELAADGGRAGLLVIDDLDVLLARYDPECGHEFLQRLATLLRAGAADGMSLVVSCRRLTGSLAGIAGLFGSRLLLRQPSRDEYVLAGGDAAMFDPDLRPGSGRWRGAVVQVARSAEAALPRSLAPAPVRVGLAQHPVLAIVAARPRTLEQPLRASGVRVVRLGRDSAPDVDALRVETSPTPTVVLGDPDDWHADWTLLTTARRDWPMVLIACSVADHRALLRDRDLPPPLGDGPGECWLSTDGQTVRAVLDLPPSASSAPESEEKRPPNR